ncbi:MAG TPA: filamentous hemagglutinin N-terminal domain-containing protein, partial [Burkholderiales bacterium]|nr:filamentous hemagglutinin N-terminal domain-containing protein [Burkholderiales bacterium]
MATTKRKSPGNNKAVKANKAGKGNQARTRRSLHTHPRVTAFAVGAAFAPWFLSSAFADPAANALPTGGQVGAGSVTISTTGTKMQIDQASDKAIINWNCFCIGSNAWVNFNQPSASAVILNRSTQAAEIFGRMSANGQVFVTSNAGVYFGRTAQVDVGSLFASSLTITDQNFLAGKYIFTKDGSAGEVVNEGNIVALGGYAALAGPQVRNNGIIIAQAGTVALASGDRVSLDMIGDGLVKVSVDAAALNALALNAGTLQADGGRVVLTARSANALLDTVINNTGVIRAKTLIERKGEIILDGGDKGIVSNSGTITATGTQAGQQGGNITIVGQYVGLWNGTRIDASGDAGGGNVNIGGNFQGQGPLQNASQTIVAKDASIKADAITDGDGGNVVVWSNDATQFFGSVSAQGGANSGNGGNVEVSGKHALNFQGTVSTLAPHGHAGTLLLDPDDLTIVHAIDATGDTSTSATAAGTTTFTEGAATDDPWQLNDFTVNTALFSNNVTITTSTGSITISGANVALGASSAGNGAPNTPADTHTLTMNSATDISWTNPWSFTGAGLLTLNANPATGTITGTGGAIDLSGGTAPLLLTAGAGIIGVSTIGLTQVAALTDTGGISISNSGAASDVDIVSLGGVDGLQGNAGAVSLTNSSGNITITSNIVASTLNLDASGALTNGAGTTVSAGGGVTLTAASIDLGNQAGDLLDLGPLTFTSAGAVNIATDSALSLAGTSTANSLVLSSTDVLTNAAAASLTVTGNANVAGTSINLGNQAGDVMNFGSLTFGSAGAVNIAENSATSLSGTSTADSLILSSTGAITNVGSASLAVANNASITGTSINLGNQATDSFNFGTLTYNSGGAVNIAEDSAMVITGTDTANSLVLASTGSITDAAATSQTIATTASFSGTSITLADNGTDTLAVTGNASFTASGGGAISIPAAGTANFGSLTFNTTGSVNITEDTATILSGTSTANSLVLTSAGSITDNNTADVTVTGNANFTANGGAAAITLNDTYAFGSLTFAGSAVTIVEADGTSLSGTSTADSLVLTSGGALTNVAASSLTVTNNAHVTGTSINLGNAAGDTVDFGTLTYTSGGAVNIAQDSAMVITGTNTADSLTLASTGSITDVVGTSQTITSGASFSGTSITLADDATDVLDVGGNAAFTASSGGSITVGAVPGGAVFGSLTFNTTGAVNIIEVSDTVLSGTSTADSLVLNSGGTITDDTPANLTVTSNASFIGTAITLADTYSFGTLTFNSAGAVNITEANSTQITGSNTVDSLTLTSAGAITNASGTSIAVTNDASFSGTSVTLANNATDTLSVGGIASFTASGGGAISIPAAGTANFGSLTFNTTGSVNITEDTAT